MSRIRFTPLIDTIQLLDISDEEYFGPKYRDYISNSRLGKINPDQGGSWEKYQAFSENLADALVFGSAVHELTLQPDDFELVPTIDRPTAKMGFMADKLYPLFLKGGVCVEDVIETSNTVDYFKGHMTDKRIADVFEKCTPYWEARQEYESKPHDKVPIYLDPTSRFRLQSCLDSLQHNRNVQELLKPEGLLSEPISLYEATILMDVKAEYEGKECILKLKAKLDHCSFDPDDNTITLNDLKTTGHYLDEFKTGSFVQYHYARQLAMYLWLWQQYIFKTYGIKDEPHSSYANIIAVCTCPDYRAGVLSFGPKCLHKGFEEFQKCLELVAQHELSRA